MHSELAAASGLAHWLDHDRSVSFGVASVLLLSAAVALRTAIMEHCQTPVKTLLQKCAALSCWVIWSFMKERNNFQIQTSVQLDQLHHIVSKITEILVHFSYSN